MASRAAAEPNEVFALVVTNNHSAEIGRPDLHYADDDGAKYYDLFRMLTSDDDVELLTELDRDSAQLFPDARAKARPPTRVEVAAAVARIATRVRRAARPTELYFVFAGHGDVDHGRGFLELRDGRLTSDDLEAILREIAATHAHVILDSCNSYFVLNPRKPGGHQIAVTEQAAASLGARLPAVGVFLSTSAEAQVFEWSELQSGIFSHAVRSGLAGAADAHHDGHVSYDELRAFVDIATARVKNPLYRPKVFARAPGGHNDAAIVDLTAAHARKLEVAPGTRLTVRDPDDLPWIDVHLEPGASTTLYLPERWAQGATLDAHETERAIAARGPNELLASLFAAPFGPKAFAAWRDELGRQPEPVFGVSGEDAERMRLLLAQVADEERGNRRLAGVIGLGFAGTLAASDLALPDLDRDRKVAALVSVAGFGVASVAMLVARSEGEKLYADFVARMADPSTDKARVVVDTERRLNALADRHRFWRKVRFGSGLVVTAIAACALVANERASESAQDRAMFRMLGGELAIAGLALSGLSLQESPTERMRGLWMTEPGIGHAPRVELSVAPLNGGGYLSLSGRF